MNKRVGEKFWSHSPTLKKSSGIIKTITIQATAPLALTITLATAPHR